MDDSHSVELEQVDVDTLYLQPAAFKRNERGKWHEAGKTIAFGLSPINGEIATWIAPRVSSAAPCSIQGHLVDILGCDQFVVVKIKVDLEGSTQ
jgi:hypothetical protein